jgi:hypothetical protein
LRDFGLLAWGGADGVSRDPVDPNTSVDRQLGYIDARLGTVESHLHDAREAARRYQEQQNKINAEQLATLATLKEVNREVMERVVPHLKEEIKEAREDVKTLRGSVDAKHNTYRGWLARAAVGIIIVLVGVVAAFNWFSVGRVKADVADVGQELKDGLKEAVEELRKGGTPE